VIYSLPMNRIASVSKFLKRSSSSSFILLPMRTFSSSSTEKRGIGFIGLGNMGGFMAANLAKAGFPLVVNDISEEAVRKLQSTYKDVKFAKTPKELASQVDQIVTMLPSSPHVQEVYLSENGILAAIKENTILIDASTIDPVVAREVSSKASSKKAYMVDAPVSGGVIGAEKGTLTFMVGGDQIGFDRAKTLLEFMGKNIVHCGGSGNGQVVKICNNLALAIEMIGISEAMNLGISLGMDPKVLAGIFNTSTARCWSSDTYNPVPGVMENVPSSRGYTGGFGVDLMAKDLGLAIGAASKLKVSLPLGGQALQVYNLMSSHGNGSKDFSAVYNFLKQIKPS